MLWPSYALRHAYSTGLEGLYVCRIVVGRAIRHTSLMLIGWGAFMIKKLIELSRGLKSKFSVSFNFRSL